MRILFVVHHFQPEPNFFAGLPFAKALVELGHEVEVLTGFPYYPIGRVYDGYRIKFLQREIMEGIPVTRVPIFPSHDSTAIRRIACYSSYALSASTIGTCVVKSADVAYVGQGPATVGIPAVILRALRRIPFVFHIMDLWPEGVMATGMFTNKLGLRATGRYLKSVYKRAGKVIVCTPGYRRKLIERGVPEDKIEVIYNWCDDAQIVPAEKDPELAKSLGMEDKFNIIFAGNMGKSQAMEAVLEAARIVKSESPRVQFLLIGGGVDAEDLKKKAAEMELSNVRFLARRPVTEIGAILSLGDVLFVHLKDEPIYKITIPSKTQAYMAVGRPVLVAVGGDTNDLVEKARAGLACEPENPRSIADAVNKLQVMSQSELDQMGANGKKYYEQELAFSIALKRMENIFESVSRKRKKKPGEN